MTSEASPSTTDWADKTAAATARLDVLYAAAAAQWPGFVERAGQVQMMRDTLAALLRARIDPAAPCAGENLAALEAGTGTGKTLAYCLAAIAASEAVGFPVVVSTATIQLQEQLVLKDLPALAAVVPSLKFELLKGRSRYLCPLNLDAIVSGDAATELDLDDVPLPSRPSVPERTVKWLSNTREAFAKGHWDGDLDGLPDWPEDLPRSRLTTRAQECRGPECRHFSSCPAYVARRRAASAHLVVANHALVLSSLHNESQWIDPKKTLFVFDEAHQLSDIAVDQFRQSVSLAMVPRIADALSKSLQKANRLLPNSDRLDLREASNALGRISLACNLIETTIQDGEVVTPQNPVLRFEHGQLSPDFAAHCDDILSFQPPVKHSATTLLPTLKAFADDSKSPKERETILQVAARLSGAATDFTEVCALFSSWQRTDAVPLAKWIELADPENRAEILLCCSPLSGAGALHQSVWSQVAAAVCTSATLQACGGFDFFLRLSGLRHYPQCRTTATESPFDYPSQGRLSVPPMKCKPKDSGFSAELAQALPRALQAHPALGSLVLFTSRRQMKACAEAMPDDLKAFLQVQGDSPRRQMLQRHRSQVDKGARSILFGLQSMGEGLDLPGAYCEHLLIDRLPFAPPGSPVTEALDEWMASQGRDAFSELAVPRTSMRMAQWVGRAIRTISDQATVTVFDGRLISTTFGRKILNGLPPFARSFGATP